MLAEGRQPDISFTAGAETYTRCAHYIGFVQHLFEEPPGTCSVGCFQPDVRSVHTAVDFQPGRFKAHYVSAHAQNLELDIIEPMLTDAEAAVLRRGKNASKATVAKHATVQEYRASTGFECLLGWLYLQGKNDRIEELFNALWEGYKPE